jgi:hypothetical protein
MSISVPIREEVIKCDPRLRKNKLIIPIPISALDTMHLLKMVGTIFIGKKKG